VIVGVVEEADAAPEELSIIANVFPAPERGKAIGVWAATAGVAIALGPLIGGFLLEHFYWGSVFLVNLPIVALGLLAGVFLIPDSKDPAAPRLDPVGAIASTTGSAAADYAGIAAMVVAGRLGHLGIDGVSAVRVGRRIELTVAAADEAAAREIVERLASELLSNPLIEAYAIEAIGATSSTVGAPA